MLLDPPAWSALDLRRRVERSLDLVAAALDLVSRETELDLEALEAPPAKIIAESAIYLRVVGQTPSVGRQIVGRAHELLRRLEPLARSDSVAFGVCVHPAVARDYAAGHILLSAAGYRNVRFDGLLDRSLAGPLRDARERVPYRALEQQWFDHLRGGPPPSPGAIAMTALGSSFDMVSGSRDDWYALTHSLFYATDFGALSPALPRPAAELLADAASAVAGALDSDDFDLAAELLMTWPMLGVPWSVPASFAFAVLARVEDEVGVLPSLAIDRAGYQRQDPRVRGDYVTATTYHTGYVMGLLCVLALRAGCAPVALPLAVRRSGSGSVSGQGDSVAGQPQWRNDFRGLGATERAELAPFVLDIELRRAVRTLDLAAVRGLLAQAVDRNVSLTPLARQASALLLRVAHAA